MIIQIFSGLLTSVTEAGTRGRYPFPPRLNVKGNAWSLYLAKAPIVELDHTIVGYSRAPDIGHLLSID